MDYRPSGSSVHRILQARILEKVAIPTQGSNLYLLHCRQSPTLQVDFLLAKPPGQVAKHFFFFFKEKKQLIPSFCGLMLWKNIVTNLQVTSNKSYELTYPEAGNYLHGQADLSIKQLIKALPSFQSVLFLARGEVCNCWDFFFKLDVANYFLPKDFTPSPTKKAFTHKDPNSLLPV